MTSLIAIIDDQRVNRTIYSRLAAAIDVGVIVQDFDNPAAALSSFRDAPPDLVITDFRMPEMDGAEFIRRFRDLQRCSDVPVIVITAYEDRDFRIGALESGATDFLLSPVDQQEFMIRVRNLLRLGHYQKLIESRADTLLYELEKTERSYKDAVRGSRERLAQVIDTIPAMISAVDAGGDAIFANTYHAEITGLSAHEASQPLGALDALVLSSERPTPAYEEEIVDRQGQHRTFLTRKFPMLDGSQRVASVLTTSFDITESKRTESHLRYMAHYDALTDLPNRVLLHTRLEEELARSKRNGAGWALHFMDLDRFKKINDDFGHQAGDELLKAVASRLRTILRGADMAARLGGDEFAIFQSDAVRAEDAAHLASRIIDAMAQPFVIGERSICASASIGIALHPQDGDRPADLLKSADLAMYRAKVSGRGQYHFFTPEMQASAREAMLLELDLRQGLPRGELLLQYQPRMNLRTGQIVGVEAQLCWNHPERGLLGPESLLGVAEASGLIVPVTRWALHEACGEAAQWQRAGLRRRVAMAMSSVLFRKEDVHCLVTETLGETRLDPTSLELELTETMVMENPQATGANLRPLQELGVQFSIGDFGTGYSSLRSLNALSLSRLKIDRSFVQNLTTETSDLAVARAIVSVGHSLALDVIAEGVETDQQARLLRAEGCHEIQGSFVGPPMSAQQVWPLLHDFGARPRSKIPA